MPTLADASLVEECRRAFGGMSAAGTREEMRQWVSLFMKRIEVDPDTGDILMHLFSRPTMLASVQTPASKETGVRIELVAGACFEAIHDTMGERLVARRLLPKNGRRSLDRAGSGTSRSLYAG
ncbi:MAG: hypothetical protein ABIE42_10275 [Candidatus Eisenbacteria bacterium]